MKNKVGSVLMGPDRFGYLLLMYSYEEDKLRTWSARFQESDLKNLANNVLKELRSQTNNV
jgi:hypothetical protein